MQGSSRRGAKPTTANASKQPLKTTKRRKSTAAGPLKRKTKSIKTKIHSKSFRSTQPQHDDPSSFLTSLMGAGDATGNPLFAAGVGLSALGVALQVLRKGALQGVVQLERHLTTSLEIPSKDRSYHWILNWCTAQTKGKSQHVGVETRVVHQGNGVHNTSFDFVPSPGRHYIWYKKNLVQIIREREKMTDLQTGNPFETVKLTLFSRNRAIFQDILQEAEQAALQKEEGRVVIYMPMMTDWRPFGRPRPKRPIESVILDDGIADFLQNDIKEFQRGGKWYKDKGIPHRRGYLLYGPPGSGKTSFIQALAGDMGYSICVLSLNDRGLSDDRLLHLMTDIPPRSILLLEDIDAVFNQRESSYSVTFSGLLNALDGVTSVDERLVFMTTNHLEKLDPALIRPGRVDAKVYIGDSTKYQQKKMFKQFFPDVVDCPFDIPDDPVELPTPTAQVIAHLEDGEVEIPESLDQVGEGDSEWTKIVRKNDQNEQEGVFLATKKTKKTDEQLEAEYLADLAKDNKPLVDFMPTDNSELLLEGAANRVKEQVEIEEIDLEGHYNSDGSTTRLSWDTVTRRISPDFFDAVDQDLPLSNNLATGRRAGEDGDIHGDLLDEEEGTEKTEEERRLAGLNRAKLDLQRQLQDLDNPVVIEIERRKAFLDVINAKRKAKGLEPVSHIKNLPPELTPEYRGVPQLSPHQKARLDLQQEKEALRWKPIQDGKIKAAMAPVAKKDGNKTKTTAKPTPKGVSLTEPAAQSTPAALKINVKQHLKKEQNKELFSAIETERLANEFAKVLSNCPISMAELQSLMLLYKDRPRMCIQGAKQLVADKLERLEKLAAEKKLVEADFTKGNSAGGVIPQEQISIVGKVNPPQNKNATMKEQMFMNDQMRANAQQKALTQPYATNTRNQKM